MKDFSKKVAVITGAGSGMGRELALQLAAAGASVVLNDWNEETLQETVQLVEAQGGTVAGRPFSVADRTAMYHFAQETVNRFGGVDIVINNAGISLLQQKIESTSYELFEKVININMWGVIYGSKAFIPFLRERPEAALVNVSSIFGIAAYPDQGAYVTAKFAVRGFTEVLRQELAKTSVSVTCVHPGGIKTNIIRNIDTQQTARLNKFSDVFDRMAKTSAADAAKRIIKGIERKEKRVLIGKDARYMDSIARLMPGNYEDTIMKGYDIEKFQ
ncbi:MAG: SDR family NAD(P)-dependent oxidoreductase [Haliscomenobacter sp.]|uniref:SDR family NAD(P)-dependent oxidoreductase n=1 Tax=Haliscomenobacter sp. TaxID=2717303 RepID=UPI0029B63C84|nr:SDR family NAD(P)-dependent oxidoreductase [Haliscomenobacter sp.]MDX2071618.1 SDR family NAD(P)-dependent oxidoreductase [Haliscomenobacter sp.]